MKTSPSETEELSHAVPVLGSQPTDLHQCGVSVGIDDTDLILVQNLNVLLYLKL